MLKLYENQEQEKNENLRWLKGDDTEEHYEALRLLIRSFGPFWRGLQSVAGQLRSGQSELARADGKHNQLEEELEHVKAERGRLQSKLNAVESVSIHIDTGTEKQDGIATLARLVHEPTLTGCLEVLEQCYPTRIVVLDSARRSAAQASDFRNVPKAFDLLWKLAREYWNQMQEGGGDAEARLTFGSKVYAAKESESLSKDGRKRRTFLFEGKNLLMEKHLKIGVAANAADTLRIHFAWLADDCRIVIGHCGCHLDF